MVCGTEISNLEDTKLSWEMQCHVGEKCLCELICFSCAALKWLDFSKKYLYQLSLHYKDLIIYQLKIKETIRIVMAIMSQCFSRGIRHLNTISHAIFVDLDLGLLNLFSNYSFTEDTWHET